MTSKQLKKFLSDHNLINADLCRILFDSSTMTDRVIVSRWLNGVIKVPRWLPKRLEALILNEKNSELVIYQSKKR